MKEYCACSGTFVIPFSIQQELKQMIHILKAIAKQHTFGYLLEILQRLELETIQ
jgi:hypothetical protein